MTRAQALASGSTTAEVDAAVRSGRWTSLRRGIYRTCPEPDDVLQRHADLVAAAVLATPGLSAGSHASAAALHGLPLLSSPPAAPIVTRSRPEGGRRGATRSAAGLVATLGPDDVTSVRGAPVTTVARTAVDLARGRSTVDAVLALDAALRQVPRQVLEQVLGQQRGWPGAARALPRLTFADGRSESALESLGRVRMRQLHLPDPELQVVVPLPSGRSARVDYLWKQHRTVGEADGRGKYDDVGALWREKRREDDLRDDGFEVFRFTWDDALRRPQVIRDRALRAFARAAGRHAA